MTSAIFNFLSTGTRIQGLVSRAAQRVWEEMTPARSIDKIPEAQKLRELSSITEYFSGNLQFCAAKELRLHLYI